MNIPESIAGVKQLRVLHNISETGRREECRNYTKSPTKLSSRTPIFSKNNSSKLVKKENATNDRP